MPVYSIIKKSELEGALRLDAEYYQPDYLDINSKVKSQKSKLLKDFAEKIFSGPFGSTLKSESYQTSGVPFIRIGDIADIFVEKENLVYISPEEHKRIFSTHLNIGDIVFSKIGTIGRLSIIDEELGQVNISENNIGIRFKNIDSKTKIFLLFFLISKYGQSQITRRGSGNIQQKLNVTDIENIIVPLFGEEFLQNLLGDYKNIIKFRKESESFYSQAEDVLLKELGFEPSFAKAMAGKQEDLVSIIRFSDIKKFRRMDAEYFQPKYEKLISKIKQGKTKLLCDFVKEYSTGYPFKSENYQERGVPLIRINNIKKGFIDLSDPAYLLEKDYFLSKKDIAKPGDIVLSMSGTIGVAAVIPDDIKKCSVNQRILKITPKDIEKDYLTLLFNSLVGSYQLGRIGTGGVQTNISYKDIKNLIVPILPQQTQQKIAELVQKSHQARQKAKELLAQAKQKVENLIEK